MSTVEVVVRVAAAIVAAAGLCWLAASAAVHRVRHERARHGGHRHRGGV
jgi:hypothetical protein